MRKQKKRNFLQLFLRSMIFLFKVQLFKWDHSKFSSQVTDTVHRNRYLFIFFYSFVFLFFFDGPQIILFRYSLFYHVLYSCLPLDSDHALRWTTFLTSFHNDRTGNVVINCHGIMKCFSLSHALDKTKTFFFQKFICYELPFGSVPEKDCFPQTSNCWLVLQSGCSSKEQFGKNCEKVFP